MIAVAIGVSAAAAFVISAVYYGAMPAAPVTEPPQRAVIAQLLVELLRNLAVAALIAGLLAVADRSGLGAGVLLGLALWTLPLVLLLGSVFHEGVPVQRAALHAVDWLLKLVAIGAIVGLFA